MTFVYDFKLIQSLLFICVLMTDYMKKNKDSTACQVLRRPYIMILCYVAFETC